MQAGLRRHCKFYLKSPEFLKMDLFLMRTGLKSGSKKEDVRVPKGQSVDMFQFVPLTNVGSPSYVLVTLECQRLACPIVGQ